MPTKMKHKPSKTVCPLQVPLGSLEQTVTQAENNDLPLEIMPFESLSLLEEARRHYGTARPSQDTMIILDRTSQSVQMTSDKRLVTHVICQMIANAVEASSMGQTVDMGCFARVETNGGGFEQINLLFGENPNKAVREWTQPFNDAGIQTQMLERGLNGIRMNPVPADVRRLMYKVKFSFVHN